ncbi:DUF2332 family protein [Yoonia sp. BS5-3]|uniref:DUF2332 domain-containing protein n=1 Tax=Yoonia phaeophyticola TaxID=3137369 RepID=A0ABZ2V9E5_9RHOB
MSTAFQRQAKACESLGSPFMGQLIRLFETRPWPEGQIRDRMFHWPGDISPRSQSITLRLTGALHALRLDGHDGLAQVYPPATPDDDTLWGAISAALITDAAKIDRWLDSPPQTNEVRRSATLIAVGHWLADRFGLPIRCSELGASAGLNLNWHRYAMTAQDNHFGAADPVLTLSPDWTGVLPPNTRPQIVAQAGVDLNPLDPHRDALRLQAYLWPDQPHRLALTKAAIGAADTAVTRGDAIDWLSGRLSHEPGQLHLIYSTVAWQYFPETKQHEGRALIEAAGKAATDANPLAWFGMEDDGGNAGAALTLRLWPGDLRIDLGRADFHGRWINWTAPATNA